MRRQKTWNKIGPFVRVPIVLVLIIGVLYLLLAPVGVSKGPRDNDTMRIANLAVGIQIYNADYDGRMPYARNDGEPVDAPLFRDVMRPYVQRDKFFWAREPGERRIQPVTSDFLYDSTAGLEARRRDELDPNGTLLSGPLFKGQDPRTQPVPCRTYGGKTIKRPWKDCQAGRTESSLRQLERF